MPHPGADQDVYVVDNPGAADEKVFVVNNMVVDASAASAGDVVEWNGSRFVLSPSSGIIVPSDYLRKDGNLSGLTDVAAARTALGLGSAATQASSAFDAAGAAAAAQAASQPLDSDLTAIAALSTTTFGRAFLALADAPAARTALALGTAATHATGDYDAAGAAAAAQAASQPLDSDLTAIAALATTTFGRSLLTQADAAAAQATLGLGTLATKSAVASADITDGTIVNADINAAAAIAASKLAMPNSFTRASGYYHRAWPSNSLTTGLETTNRLIAYRMPLGNAVTISRIGLEITTIGDAGRSVADLVTNGTTTITSATAAFVSTDQGRLVTGTNIPNGTFIQSVTNGTTAVLTQAATGSGSGGTLNISGAIIRLGIFADSSGLPGALLLDTGVSGTANSGGAAMFANAGVIDGRTQAVQEITVNLALAAGDYWVGYVAQGVTSVAPTTRVHNLHSGMAVPLGAATPSANLNTMACQQTAVVVGLPNPMVTGSFVNNPASIFIKV